MSAHLRRHFSTTELWLLATAITIAVLLPIVTRLQESAYHDRTAVVVTTTEPTTVTTTSSTTPVVLIPPVSVTRTTSARPHIARCFVDCSPLGGSRHP